MQNSRETRLLEVERLAATGMSYAGIAARLGVHARTVADDMATVRYRRALRIGASVETSPQIVSSPLRSEETGMVGPYFLRNRMGRNERSARRL